MTDALTKGSERLAAALFVSIDCEGSWGGGSIDSDDIASDPGIKALVELVQAIRAGSSAYWGVAGERALKLWEDGDA